MRAALKILAILAIVLSGFTTSEIRAAVGMAGDATVESAIDNDTPSTPEEPENKPCSAGDNLPDEGTSDCNATAAFLISNQTPIFALRIPVPFQMFSERVNGFWPSPSKQPPKS